MPKPLWVVRRGNPRVPRFILGVVVALATLGLAAGHWASTTGHSSPVQAPHVQGRPINVGGDVTPLPPECRPVVGYTC